MIGNRRIITSFFLILFIAVVITASYFALNKIKKETSNNIRNSLQTVLLTVQDSHLNLISQRKMEADYYAENQVVVSLTTELLNLHNKKAPLIKSIPLLKLRKHISPILAKYDDEGFFIIAPDRISIASMRDINIDSVNLIHKQKKLLLDKTFLGESQFISTIHSDVLLDANRNVTPESTPTMFITTPIRIERDVIAVLAFRVNPKKYFSNITKLGRIGESGETYAFNKKGLLITESRFTHQLVSTNQITVGQKGLLNIRITDPGGDLLGGYKKINDNNELPLTFMAASATAGNSDFNIEGYRDYRGKIVFGAWLWNEQLGFGLTTEIDAEEAMLPYYRTRDTFIAVITITLVLGLLMLYFIFRIQAESKNQLKEAYIELEDRVQQRTLELVQAKNELSKINEELSHLVDTDPLTGLSNRRNFEKQLNLEWQRCIRDKKPLSIILFDIDYFKQYNDTYGHLMGDNCLKDISIMLMGSRIAKRPTDVIARYGGEEFIVLLSDADEDYAQKASNLLRSELERMNIPHKDTKVKGQSNVTISVGFATEHKLENIQIKSLIQKADDCMYKAKASGRNNVCGYSAKSFDNVLNIDDSSKKKL